MCVEDRPPLAILVGPTASGKSDLGLAWAEHLGGEIISADSIQVYRYMDIGTAKPSVEVRRRLPHHLVDLVDPDESFSAAQFEQLAACAINEISRRGKVPLLVGGTGLYIRALMYGLFEGPQGDAELREQFKKMAQTHGTGKLHERLHHIDPEAAERIHPHDLFRIIRALEVFELTRIPISRHQQRHGFGQKRYRAIYYGLGMDRSRLYQRIHVRAEEMVARGLIQEVEALLDRGYGLDLPSMRAIGYRHVGCYLQGMLSLGEALCAMKRDTRQYAKRQMTWFRGMPEIRWFTTEEAPKILEELQGFFDETL